MYTYNDLIDDLKLSFKPTDTIMIHSSFSSIKNIEGGSKTVLKALKDYFKDGLVIIPTHTWKTITNDFDTFIKDEPNSCVGCLTNEAIKDPDFIRSNHPTHSVVAYGKNALEYIKGDDITSALLPSNGSFGKLKNNGKILFIGCPLSKNTFVHTIEEEMNVPNRFTEHIYTFYSKDKDHIMEYHIPRHYNANCPHISDNYIKLLPIMLEKRISKKVKILDSESYLVDAKGCYELVKGILKKDIHAFDDMREIKELVSN